MIIPTSGINGVLLFTVGVVGEENLSLTCNNGGISCSYFMGRFGAKENILQELFLR